MKILCFLSHLFLTILLGTECGIAQNLTVEWCTPVGNGSGSASPAMSPDQQTIYITTGAKAFGEAKLYAFNKEGQSQWNKAFDLKKDGASYDGKQIKQESACCVSSEGVIYASFGGSGLTKGYLYAVNSDGSQKWKYTMEKEGMLIFQTPPALLPDQRIVLGTRGVKGGIRIIDSEDGTLTDYNPGSGWGVHGNVVVNKDGVAYAHCQKGIYGYKVNNMGRLKELDNYVCDPKNTPGAFGMAIDSLGNVYGAGGAEGSGHIFSIRQGGKKINWVYPMTKDLSQIDQGGIVIGLNGTIYASADKNNLLFALNQQDGTLRWSYETYAPISCTPAIDNLGQIHFGDMDGNYYVLKEDGDEYKEIFKGQLKKNEFKSLAFWSSPLIADDGTIYVAAQTAGNGFTSLFSLKLEGVTGPASTAWPMKGGDAQRSGLQK